MLSSLDIYAKAGSNAAYFIGHQASVSDGEISIEFVIVTENALINAIEVEVLSQSGEPIVNFTVNPSVPKPGATVTVDASASYDPDGSISNYLVNWGDGTTTYGAVTSHSYTSEGE